MTEAGVRSEALGKVNCFLPTHHNLTLYAFWGVRVTGLIIIHTTECPNCPKFGKHDDNIGGVRKMQ